MGEATARRYGRSRPGDSIARSPFIQILLFNKTAVQPFPQGATIRRQEFPRDVELSGQMPMEWPDDTYPTNRLRGLRSLQPATDDSMACVAGSMHRTGDVDDRRRPSPAGGKGAGPASRNRVDGPGACRFSWRRNETGGNAVASRLPCGSRRRARNPHVGQTEGTTRYLTGVRGTAVDYQDRSEPPGGQSAAGSGNPATCRPGVAWLGPEQP
jgi:hypothetical protein